MNGKIGELLVGAGLMTAEHTENVLRIQQAGYQFFFAEIAIELGYLEDYAPKSFVEFREELCREMAADKV